MLDSLPSNEQIRDRLQIRLDEPLAIQILVGPMDVARAALASKGFENLPAIAEFNSPSGLVHARTTWVLGSSHLRAITKIAFNYLAATQGPNVACMPQFNDARRSVLAGIEPPHRFLTAVNESMRVDRKPTGTPVRGHLLALLTSEREQVVAHVSLFLRIRYRILLASGGFALPVNLSSAHFFDVDTRKIEQVPASSVEQPHG